MHKRQVTRQSVRATETLSEAETLSKSRLDASEGRWSRSGGPRIQVRPTC